MHAGCVTFIILILTLITFWGGFLTLTTVAYKKWLVGKCPSEVPVELR